ncbi:hypothetical protein KGF54_003679 [Candida jiufengensis]|uniref:uncharacterized protein n=1 Tax=Candida jiufengensis TaxID=497108 RepID=UPI0022254809|nr:uncharacterized protein KGF54_003679 [Candida jiufengensis]KAI5952812.1 hypothetical protein KGF54_003679 [Candida jiufengensis]
MSIKDLADKIRPKYIISDWDETITTEDTIQYVGEVPYLKNPNLQPPFKHFSEIYYNSYKNYKSKHKLDTIDDYVEFLEGMNPIESSSIDQLQQHKIFQNLSKQDFLNQSTKIKLRPSVIGFFQKCNSLNIPVYILSTNWTSLIIEDILTTQNNLELAGVITNDFVFQDGKTTGNWDTTRDQIRTSVDKLSFVQQYIEKDSDKNDIMYIGDSTNDLLPILEVDYPCCIKDSKLDTILDDFKIDHYSGDWKEFIDLID